MLLLDVKLAGVASNLAALSIVCVHSFLACGRMNGMFLCAGIFNHPAKLEFRTRQRCGLLC